MLILAFLTSLTMHLLLFSYSQLKESIIHEMGLTYAEAGIIFSMSILALVALRIPWGIIIDRLGIRQAGGLTLTILGVFGVLRGFTTNYETLLLSQLFLGIGLAAVMPCLPKLVSAWFPPERAGFAIGVAISGYAVGDIIGLSATPYLLMCLVVGETFFLRMGFGH
jgi:MFS family permease